MKHLLKQLQAVSEVAPRGAHRKVAYMLNISTCHLLKIRKGINLTVDNPRNREIFDLAIKGYTVLIKDEKIKLDKVL